MTKSDPGTILGAIVAEGIYVLDSPAHFGGGETDDTDMALLRHAADYLSLGTPFIPGSSIAGAGRAALDSRVRGWAERRANPESEDIVIQQLFGNNSLAWDCQSALIVSDAELYDAATKRVAVPPVQTLLRDGVAIDPKLGTAVAGHKYDMEALASGTQFRLRFELVIRSGHTADVRTAFYTLLQEFSSTDWPIRLGARVHRGYGNGRVREWRVRGVRFDSPGATIAEDAAWWLTDRVPTQVYNSQTKELLADRRRWMHIRAQFSVKSSLLVRTYSTTSREPDMTPVRGGIAPNAKPVVPGTAIAGACRQRALRIANTLAPTDTARARALISSLFGPDPDELKRLGRDRNSRRADIPVDSRVTFDESVVDGGTEEVQSRIHIDPFTGGVHHGPFDEQAVWSGRDPATLIVNIRARDPRAEEIGLLLTVFKDLWLEDLPLGGGAGIGRGVLRGTCAKIKLRTPVETREWEFAGKGCEVGLTGLTPEQAEQLNAYAKKLVSHLGESVATVGN